MVRDAGSSQPRNGVLPPRQEGGKTAQARGKPSSVACGACVFELRGGLRTCHGGAQSRSHSDDIVCSPMAARMYTYFCLLERGLRLQACDGREAGALPRTRPAPILASRMQHALCGFYGLRGTLSGLRLLLHVSCLANVCLGQERRRGLPSDFGPGPVRGIVCLCG